MRAPQCHVTQSEQCEVSMLTRLIVVAIINVYKHLALYCIL